MGVMWINYLYNVETPCRLYCECCDWCKAHGFQVPRHVWNLRLCKWSSQSCLQYPGIADRVKAGDLKLVLAFMSDKVAELSRADDMRSMLRAMALWGFAAANHVWDHAAPIQMSLEHSFRSVDAADVGLLA